MAAKTRLVPDLVYPWVTTTVTMSTSIHVKAWRRATKERMVASMGGKCQCCGYDRCVESMDFHHLDPSTKEMPLGDARANPTVWPKIVAELRKCILVCRNCHGELHYGKRQLPETYAQFDERYVEYKTHAELSDPCPRCQTPKPTHNKFCSLKCAGYGTHWSAIDWESIDLIKLAQIKTLKEVGDELGVSDSAVKYQLKKRGVNIRLLTKQRTLRRKMAARAGVDPASSGFGQTCLD